MRIGNIETILVISTAHIDTFPGRNEFVGNGEVLAIFEVHHIRTGGRQGMNRLETGVVLHVLIPLQSRKGRQEKFGIGSGKVAFERELGFGVSGQVHVLYRKGRLVYQDGKRCLGGFVAVVPYPYDNGFLVREQSCFLGAGDFENGKILGHRFAVMAEYGADGGRTEIGLFGGRIVGNDIQGPGRFPVANQTV